MNLPRCLRGGVRRRVAIGYRREGPRAHVRFALPYRDHSAEESSPAPIAFDEIDSEERQLQFVRDQLVGAANFLPAVPLRRPDEGAFLWRTRGFPSGGRRLVDAPDDVADALISRRVKRVIRQTGQTADQTCRHEIKTLVRRLVEFQLLLRGGRNSYRDSLRGDGDSARRARRDNFRGCPA